MKKPFAILLGVLIGLALPYVLGRELRITVVHELKLPVRAK